MPSAPKIHRPANAGRKRRRSPAERGYDWQWKRLRDEYVAANPLCEHCLQEGVTQQGDEVDHIKPISGPNDPLRLDWSNLQHLCRSHHKRKTDQDLKR